VSDSPALAGPLALLRAHQAQPLESPEVEMVADALAFAQSHPDCLLRTCLTGHLTGSAWVRNAAGDRGLFTLHRKLGRWLNPGGHADGDADLAAVALREATEESGLKSVRLVSRRLLDFDRHWIPERRDVPGHWHYDFRFLCEADEAEPLAMTEESTDLAWLGVADVLARNPEASLRRLAAKAAGARR
jgi:8-oxo-dGTP pyrophosphatase MutT (NUDIX family)